MFDKSNVNIQNKSIEADDFDDFDDLDIDIDKGKSVLFMK
jgi:hypothetical protein